ncbi:MAG: PaaI family thioesterase [Burkholderiaceae bacterium]|nr:PaaI family thioesterase [Burkholderiaceae bacterium]
MDHENPGPDGDAEATLELWLAREREVRLLMAAPGKIPLAEIARTSGLEFLERIGRGEIASPPIMQTLDFVPVEIERGRMVFQGTPKPDYYNPIGSVHGGYIATLLDSAVACAVQTMLERGFGLSTLELKVNYLRPLTDKTGPVRAEGYVLNVSRQIGLAQGRLVDPAGRMYAWASSTCLIFPLSELRAS